MSMRRLGFLILAALLVAGCGESQPQTKKITLVATGFLKGNLMPFQKEYSRKRTRVLGGFAHLAGRVRELEKQAGDGLLLVDLGNDLSGSLESYVSKGQMVVDMMNRLPYSASLLNNMEFTYGQDQLKARTAQAKFAYVSTNVKFTDAALGQRVVPEVVKTIAGFRVAILGFTPENLLQICAPDVVKGVTVEPNLDHVVRRAAELKKEGADLVVLLSKLGIDAPGAAVKKVLTDGPIDVVLGIDYSQDGEAQATWGKTVVTGLPGDNRGSRVKVIELSFDASRKIVGHNPSVEVISPETNPADAEVGAALDKFKATVMAQFAEKVGVIGAPLTKGWREEALLGDLIADGMKASAGADLAIINSGAIQDELLPGDATVKDLFRVVPFDNNILVVQVTGAALKEAFGKGLAQGTTFQVSGFEYRAREIPAGGVELVEITQGGKPLDETKQFKVAITDFALSRMDTLKGLTPQVKDTVRNVLTQTIKTAPQPVERKADGRVRFDKIKK